MVQLSILLVWSAACIVNESPWSNWFCDEWGEPQPGVCRYHRRVVVSSIHAIHSVDVCFMSINETPNALTLGISSCCGTLRWICVAVTWRCQWKEDFVPQFSFSRSQQTMKVVVEGGRVRQMEDSGWCPLVAVMIMNVECGLSRYGVIQRQATEAVMLHILIGLVTVPLFIRRRSVVCIDGTCDSCYF